MAFIVPNRYMVLMVVVCDACYNDFPMPLGYYPNGVGKAVFQQSEINISTGRISTRYYRQFLKIALQVIYVILLVETHCSTSLQYISFDRV